MHHDLGPVDAIGVGMYLQTLILGLTARGLGTCVEASLGTYPEVIRRELSIPDELAILCGLALGYADPDRIFRRRGGVCMTGARLELQAPALVRSQKSFRTSEPGQA